MGRKGGYLVLSDLSSEYCEMICLINIGKHLEYSSPMESFTYVMPFAKSSLILATVIRAFPVILVNVDKIRTF